MKINAKQVLKDAKGLPIDSNTPGEALTLAEVLTNSLNTTPSKDAYRSYKLAIDFATKDEVDLNTPDYNLVIEVLKTQKMYIPLAAGQAIDILENGAKTPITKDMVDELKK